MTYEWPQDAVEVTPEDLRDTDVDVVVLQRPEELELATAWLDRRPGRDVPAVYVEHNTPRGDVPETRHHLADRDDVTVVHVTHFNRLMWDTGRAPTVVVEHGVADPGPRYDGSLPRIAAVVNEPVRRTRVAGTDLLARFAEVAPVDLYGIGTEAVTGTSGITVRGDVPQADMHAELARRRVYLHPFRWTSLGLTLIEAMMLGLPVVAAATTEAGEAVPSGAGVVSNDVGRLVSGTRRLLADPRAAREAGARGRAGALARYGLGRFLADWDVLLKEVTACGSR